MDLFIAGVIHPDPLGRDKLSEWLDTLRHRCPEPPAFIAVEYAMDDFIEIRRQRGTLGQLAEGIWPDAPLALVRALAPSVAYGADTHTEVFPGQVEVLWLDEFRKNRPPGAVQNFAADRLSDYRDMLAGEDLSQPIRNLLTELSRRAWDAAEKQRRAWTAAKEKPPTTRDEEFARLITQRVGQGGGGWAIAVVGSSHASDQEGRMLRRLLDAGVTCTVTVLDPRAS